MNTIQVVFGDRLYVYVCYVYKLILGMCYLVLYLFVKNKIKYKKKKHILICVPKMNGGHMGLEQH